MFSTMGNKKGTFSLFNLNFTLTIFTVKAKLPKVKDSLYGLALYFKSKKIPQCFLLHFLEKSMCSKEKDINQMKIRESHFCVSKRICHLHSVHIAIIMISIDICNIPNCFHFYFVLALQNMCHSKRKPSLETVETLQRYINTF